jgi:hypothetical protein
MDISVRTDNYQVENHSWLGSAHGTDAGRSITLDVSTFTAGTHYPNGYIPSGVVLGKITATGLYGPYNNGASDGREVAAGHLLTATEVQAAATTIDVGAVLLEHGIVIEAKLPSGHGLDANGKTDLAGRITYR